MICAIIPVITNLFLRIQVEYQKNGPYINVELIPARIAIEITSPFNGRN
jgi:hypothetical protein